MVPRTFWTWSGRFLTPARSSLPTDGRWARGETKAPLATLLLEHPFQPPQKSWEIGNRPESRVPSSGRPRTSDTNHPRGVTPLYSNFVFFLSRHFTQPSQQFAQHNTMYKQPIMRIEDRLFDRGWVRSAMATRKCENIYFRKYFMAVRKFTNIFVLLLILMVGSRDTLFLVCFT